MSPGPSRVLVLLIYAAFVSLGLPDGILGAAWPSMRADFAVGLNDNWLMLTLGMCGGVLSSFASGFFLRRLGVGRVLILTTFLTAFVILGYALNATFAAITLLSFLLGLGNGAIDAGLNNYVATNLSSRHMSWLHACWGVGISTGTLIVSGAMAASGSWRTAYLAVGLVQLSLALAFSLGFKTPPPASASASASAEPVAPSLWSTFRVPAACASMATFFVYCGLECGIGLWISSLLHDGRGWSVETAGLMVTLYWSSLTVGRFLIGAVSERTTPMRIVRGATLGVTLGTSLIAASSLPPAPLGGLLTALGLLLTGLGLSPIYPMLMHDTPRCVGLAHALNLTGFQAGCGSLGYTLLPIALGTLMRTYSTEWLGGALAVLSLLIVALLALRERHTPAAILAGG